MTSAQIAARQAILAALEAEFQAWMSSTNIAITRLNAATAGGDTALYGVANAAIVVVNALNPYHVVLLKAIADAALLVPDDPPPPPPPPPPPSLVLNLPVLQAGFDMVVGQETNLDTYAVSAKPITWTIDPSAYATLTGGKLKATQAGNTTVAVTADDGA